ncbi:MAG: hypothetical protein RLY86_3697 [Pseudomonadota bacterium]|jgi:hypothetical protein
MPDPLSIQVREMERDCVRDLLARWLGVSDVAAATLSALAEELQRTGDQVEEQANRTLDRVSRIIQLSGMDHLTTGLNQPRSPEEDVIAAEMRAISLSLQQADKLRQVLHQAAAVLTAVAAMEVEQAAATIGSDHSLRSTGAEEAWRLQQLHPEITLGPLRRKLMTDLGLD